MEVWNFKCALIVAFCWMTRAYCKSLEHLENHREPHYFEFDADFDEPGPYIETFHRENQNKPHLNDEVFGNDENKNKKKMFLLFFNTNNDSTGAPSDAAGALDHWSILWYIASFGGLVLFFLIISCSEWCCRTGARGESAPCAAAATPSADGDSPPPSYDQFAPPSYDSILGGRTAGPEKCEFDVYVVPAHALSSLMGRGAAAEEEDAPPSYLSTAGASAVI